MLPWPEAAVADAVAADAAPFLALGFGAGEGYVADAKAEPARGKAKAKKGPTGKEKKRTADSKPAGGKRRKG